MKRSLIGCRLDGSRCNTPDAYRIGDMASREQLFAWIVRGTAGRITTEHGGHFQEVILSDGEAIGWIHDASDEAEDCNAIITIKGGVLYLNTTAQLLGGARGPEYSLQGWGSRL